MAALRKELAAAAARLSELAAREEAASRAAADSGARVERLAAELKQVGLGWVVDTSPN